MHDAAGSVRLNRYLAQCGLGARRKVEAYITAGTITVNGALATLQTRVQQGDRVLFQGQVLEPKRCSYVLFNKPLDCVCSRDDRMISIYEYIDRRFLHLNYVGRLDRHSTGLLLLSNDGDLAQRLMHPSGEIQKVYEVQTSPTLAGAQLRALQQGVTLDDGFIQADEIISHGGMLRIVLHSGRYRIIRRMIAHVGARVVSLDRVAYGPLRKKGLSRGRCRVLTAEEVDDLYVHVGA